MPESVDPQEHVASWHQARELERELIGSGNEGAVYRRRFDTPQGERYYAHKEAKSETEAIRTYAIYKDLQEAGLPVADFLKTHHYKDEVYGEDRTALIMEDVSHDGKYQLKAAGDFAFAEVAGAKDPKKLQKDMVRALAVMHNLGIYDFHPGLAMSVRVNKDDPSDVDFVFIDYSNMQKPENPTETREFGPIDFEEECQADRVILLSGIGAYGEAAEELTDYYNAIRDSGIQHYSLEDA